MKIMKTKRRITLAAAALLVAPTMLLAPASATSAQSADDLADPSPVPNLCTIGGAENSTGLPAFARGSDGTLVYSARTIPGAYLPFVSTGRPIVGDPANDEYSYVVARGADDQLIYSEYTIDGPNPFLGFGVAPGLQLSGDPTAVPLEFFGSIIGTRVFAPGPDGRVYTNNITRGGPSGWVPVGDLVVTSEIATTVVAGGGGLAARLVARGQDGRVYSATFVEGSPTTWSPLGDLQATSNPDVSTRGGITGARAFVRGPDNALWVYDLDGGGPWQSLGGSITSDPSAAGSVQDGMLRVFARGTDNAVYVNTFDGTAWSGFQSLGGNATGNPSTFLGYFVARSQVLVRGTDNAMYVNSLPNGGGGWSGFVRVAGQLC